MPSVGIIGGGPSGLMAAETLLKRGVSVCLYETKPSIGRKFLMAGKSGLNITHAEDLDDFLDKYDEDRVKLEPYIREFPPLAVREWTELLGEETFEGTSRRIFPKTMKASPLLRKWLARLTNLGLKIHLKHKWSGLGPGSELCFSTPKGFLNIKHDAIILALGGASWPRLGSDANWLNIINKHAIKTFPFKPSNCGFNVDWSNTFKFRFSGVPVKSCKLSVGGNEAFGDFNITDYGIEGGVIYFHSRKIQNEIAKTGHAIIKIDLIPRKNTVDLLEQISKARGKNTLTNHLRKTAKLNGVKTGLLREFTQPEDLKVATHLVDAIKSIKIRITESQPIDRAISSSGGISFKELDEKLMITKIPGVFASGEMLNWDAPTGGYLLTACLALGKSAANGTLEWLDK
ncbi:MAG: TIGR03862 family flavoprotein [Alphaproteobacteria bacterium]|nr:TIGR03862 family flavoprotein [Alphaproteobacteria bacterium]